MNFKIQNWRKNKNEMEWQILTIIEFKETAFSIAWKGLKSKLSGLSLVFEACYLYWVH